MADTFKLRVNGVEREISAEPNTPLLYILRNDLKLKGTRFGCGEGHCGACTVLVDGQPVVSCLQLAQQVRGREVTTIEGLERDGELSDVQAAFVSNGAAQCGFCTPGMIVSAEALLVRNPSPSEAEIREALSGNLCRCTGYNKIVDAVLEAAQGRAGVA